MPATGLAAALTMTVALAVFAGGGETSAATTGPSIVTGDAPRMALDPSGTRLYVADSGGLLQAVDATTSKQLTKVTIVGKPSALTTNPAGTRLFMAGSAPNAVSVVDAASLALVATVPLPSSPSGLAISPDGTRLYVASWDAGAVWTVDTATNAVVATTMLGVGPTQIAVSRDSSRVFTVNPAANSITAIDAASATVVATGPVGTSPSDVVTSPADGRLLVTLRGDNKMVVVDPGSLAVVGGVDVGTGPTDLAVTADGGRAFVANTEGPRLLLDRDSSVFRIDLATLTVTGTVGVPAGPTSIVVNPSGTRGWLASGGKGPIAVLDLTTAKSPKPLPAVVPSDALSASAAFTSMQDRMSRLVAGDFRAGEDSGVEVDPDPKLGDIIQVGGTTRFSGRYSNGTWITYMDAETVCERKVSKRSSASIAADSSATWACRKRKAKDRDGRQIASSWLPSASISGSGNTGTVLTTTNLSKPVAEGGELEYGFTSLETLAQYGGRTWSGWTFWPAGTTMGAYSWEYGLSSGDWAGELLISNVRVPKLLAIAKLRRR